MCFVVGLFGEYLGKMLRFLRLQSAIERIAPTNTRAVDLGARFNFALQSDSDFVLLQGKMPEDLVPLLAGAAMASRRLWLIGITIDGM